MSQAINRTIRVLCTYNGIGKQQKPLESIPMESRPMPFTPLEPTVDGDTVIIGIPGAGHATGMIPKRFPAATTFDSPLVGLLVGETWGMGTRELGGEVVDGEGGPVGGLVDKGRGGGGGHADAAHWSGVSRELRSWWSQGCFSGGRGWRHVAEQ